MKAVIQRVIKSSVSVNGEIVGESEKGYMILLGVVKGDTDKEAQLLAAKTANLRVFEDENGNVVTKDANDYIEYAMGWDASKRFPLFVKPARKISVKDVADVMRDHYEGTPMDMTQDIGAGGNALPYRWRPMGFEHDGKKYVNERAIATQQTGF